MKTKLFLLFILCCHSFLLAETSPKKPPLSVLIVGGGPAGLATAIEAKTQGYQVTVIEKRESYSRPRLLFLFNSALQLLERQQVALPQMHVIPLGEKRTGIVQTNHLEEQLEKRAKELGVKKLCAKFCGMGEGRTILVSTPQNKESALAYDILVGADGSHSAVRQALSIEQKCLGTGVGAFAISFETTDSSTPIEVSPPVQVENGFIRRIKTPSISIVFVQFPKQASKHDLQKALQAQKWDQEAKAINGSKTVVVTDVGVSLSQALTFSDEKRSALLVGDAAASASFFQGKGANTALQTAEVAGHFFKEMAAGSQDAFHTFNQAIKKTTDAMIEDSAFLFHDPAEPK